MPQPRIDVDPNRIADFCRRWGIVRLSLFGSVLRDDFRADSDVDVLVEYEPGKTFGLEYFDMRDEIEEIFGRHVDLIDVQTLRNPFRRKEILRTQSLIYAA